MSDLPQLSQFDRIITRNSFDHHSVQCYPDFTFILEGNKANGEKLIKDLFKKYKAELYENIVILTLNSFLCVREKVLARDYVTFEKVCYDLSKLMD
ncbi:MAG: hypothetical protein GTO02_14690, partial [Candidatus Dadabacteria bacterium]|nr:hypothetical protein [Candidatus Dadabacteria bacterium]